MQGGCAVTDCAMRSGKWDKFIINDIDIRPLRAFTKGIMGLYDNETRWISREDFFRLKDTDEYVACCFSFGTDYRTYCYGKNVEPYKKALHYAIVYRDYSLIEKYGLDCTPLDNIETIHDRRIGFRKLVLDKYLKENKIGKKGSHYYFKEYNGVNSNIEQLQNIECCEQLKRLQSLKGLSRLQNIERWDYLAVYNKNYYEVDIPDNATIYCDIPYRGTNKYDGSLDYNKFYDWALSQKQQVFISEYNMPEQFTCIAEKEIKSLMSASTNSISKTEKIFVNRL